MNALRALLLTALSATLCLTSLEASGRPFQTTPDKLVLNNGKVFQGEIIEETGQAVKIRTRAGVLTFPSSMVKEITRGEVQVDELAELRQLARSDDRLGAYCAAAVFLATHPGNEEAEKISTAAEQELQSQLIQLLDQALILNKYDDSLKELGRWLEKLDPASPLANPTLEGYSQLLFRQAELFTKQQQLPEALSLIETAPANAAKHPPVAMLRAQLLIQADRLPEAEQALKIKPAEAGLKFRHRTLLLQCQLRQKKYREAANTSLGMKLLEIEPVTVQSEIAQLLPQALTIAVGQALAEGKKDEARACADYFLELAPRSADTYHQAREMFVSLGEAGLATQAQRRAEALDVLAKRGDITAFAGPLPRPGDWTFLAAPNLAAASKAAQTSGRHLLLVFQSLGDPASRLVRERFKDPNVQQTLAPWCVVSYVNIRQIQGRELAKKFGVSQAPWLALCDHRQNKLIAFEFSEDQDEFLYDYYLTTHRYRHRLLAAAQAAQLAQQTTVVQAAATPKPTATPKPKVLGGLLRSRFSSGAFYKAKPGEIWEMTQAKIPLMKVPLIVSTSEQVRENLLMSLPAGVQVEVLENQGLTGGWAKLRVPLPDSKTIDGWVHIEGLGKPRKIR